MSSDNKPMLPKSFFVRRFGRQLGFLFGLVVVTGLILWNWEKIQNLPGVSPIISRISQKSLPKADPRHFAIAIAHLENDKDHQYEVLIAEALKRFEGVQVLRFDRTISPSKETDEAGHDQAREYLKESGAHVLIWGLVHRIGGESAPRLYWTTSRESKRAKEVYQLERFELPELFWNDLVEVLRLAVVTHSAEFSAQAGRYIADQLEPFIKKVRELLESAGQQGWDTDTRAQVRVILADSLSTFGEQAGKNEPLEEAVEVYREALKERTRERVPLKWAVTQNNLGNALSSLGEREPGTERLEEAVEVYREALKERTRERVPLKWAVTQNNLGNALSSLGEREPGTERLEEAVSAYREALKEQTRERVPLDWAITQNNLGATLGRLGEREPGTERLEEAVAAYREALKERTRDRVPLDWAITQYNLGATLARLGEREPGTERLEEAVEVYREALKEQTRERVPLDWAMTQNNLGATLGRLGEREPGTERLEEAVSAYREALKEQTRERVPLDWATTQTNLGTALVILGEREKNAKLVCEALEKHITAWEVFSPRAHFYASAAGRGAKKDIDVLRREFEPATYLKCLARYEEALKRIGLS